MNDCRHKKLQLITGKKNRLRCRRCHLTINEDELKESFCPECFEKDSSKNNSFDKIEMKDNGNSKYRCEECGIIFDC